LIDPVVFIYSTYLGGSVGDRSLPLQGDTGWAIAVDGAGNAYVTGSTSSTNFPTANPVQSSYGGDLDVSVTKINAAGSALVYSTYLGGSGADIGYGIAVDSAGNAYVTGTAASANFPTVKPFQASLASTAGNAFITKINAAGLGSGVFHLPWRQRRRDRFRLWHRGG
jgi:hypothetical protein